MKYTNLVLKHPVYQKFIQDIKRLEADRIYCCHKLEHAVDVARLAWIYYLEDRMTGVTESRRFLKGAVLQSEDWQRDREEGKDLFYTAALLHDIGRVSQYETGVHHAISGQFFAQQILKDIGAPDSWWPQIRDVISEHSEDTPDKKQTTLLEYITRSDHDCRLCFACGAKDSCKWTEDEKNEEIHS